MEQFTVEYLMLNGWVEASQVNLYRFYTKGKFTIKTRRNAFPLEIYLYKSNVLIMSAYIPTVNFWKTKTRKWKNEL